MKIVDVTECFKLKKFYQCNYCVYISEKKEEICNHVRKHHLNQLPFYEVEEES